jgi:hypothetical protein
MCTDYTQKKVTCLITRGSCVKNTQGKVQKVGHKEQLATLDALSEQLPEEWASLEEMIEELLSQEDDPFVRLILNELDENKSPRQQAWLDQQWAEANDNCFILLRKRDEDELIQLCIDIVAKQALYNVLVGIRDEVPL